MEFSVDGFQNTITRIRLNEGTSSGLQARDPTVGNPSIVATDSAAYLSPDTKSNIYITPGPAHHLNMTGIPGSIEAGDPQNVFVEVLDEWNNLKTDYTGTVTFSTSDQGAGVSLPDDYTYDLDDAGFKTFPDGVVLVTADSDQWVRVRDASNASINDIIENIDVTPASADSLDISGIPDDMTAGNPSPFTVTVLDRFQNVVTHYAGRVRFSTNDTGNGVVVPPDYTFSPVGDGGIHLFDNPGLILVTAGPRFLEVEEIGNPSVHGQRSGINVVHTSVDSLILTPCTLKPWTGS
jgi:hypothetical protein